MRNILLLQLETKIVLAIIMIFVAIFLFTLYKSVNNFNKFIDKINVQYEEMREP